MASRWFRFIFQLPRISGIRSFTTASPLNSYDRGPMLAPAPGGHSHRQLASLAGMRRLRRRARRSALRASAHRAPTGHSHRQLASLAGMRRLRRRARRSALRARAHRVPGGAKRDQVCLLTSAAEDFDARELLAFEVLKRGTAAGGDVRERLGAEAKDP